MSSSKVPGSTLPAYGGGMGVNMTVPGAGTDGGPMVKSPSGVFSPLQSPLSSPRINYPPTMGMPLVSVAGGGGKQLPPLNHPAQPNNAYSAPTGPAPGAAPASSSSSFVSAFPGQQTGGAGNLGTQYTTATAASTSSASSHMPLPPVSAQSNASSSTSTYEQEVERMSVYARTKLDAVMKDLLQSLFANSPVDPVQYMITWLQEYQKKNPAEPPNQLPFLTVAGGPRDRSSRRSAISAEPLNRSNLPNTVIPKSSADKARIRQALRANILFNTMDEEQMDICLDAMQLNEYKAGDNIITQGDSGEHFYVVDSGDCECFVWSQEKPKPRLVRKYAAGDTFGELALMYGCPRTATVRAKTAVSVWAMDRLTFHRVLMETTAARREKYEKFLAQVPLFAGLDRYERARIADALNEEQFEHDEFVVEQGDDKNNTKFYLVAEGEARALKTFGDADRQLEVMRYKPGDYFGELVLMPNGGASKRSASVKAIGNVKVFTLDRGVFLRLLGPLQEVLKRTRATYETIEKELETYVRDGKANIAPPVYYQKRRRTGVSAESSSETSKALDLKVKQVVIPKSAQQLANIRRAIANNFCFQTLDDDTLKKVLDAMFEVKFKAGDLIIEQGADGDYFYVVDQGVCECFIRSAGSVSGGSAAAAASSAAGSAAGAVGAAAGGSAAAGAGGQQNLGKFVATYEHGESFGELALMYNTPRAASIRAKTPSVVLWAVDRVTFRYHIMESTNRKRKRYEEFLSAVPLLSSLDRYERSKIADCLSSHLYSDGEYIIRQNDPGDTFFFLEEGKAKATKHVTTQRGGKPVTDAVDVFHYDVGAYFGELALITSQPRAANVVAVGPCRCVCIDRASFTRLLGPMNDILRRNLHNYREMERKLGVTIN